MMLISVSYLQSTAIEIGFTLPRINHTEDERQFTTLVNKSRLSEQTFYARIEVSTPRIFGVGRTATPGVDFVIVEGLPTSQVFLELAPEDNSIDFGYRIVGDMIPENVEIFQLSISPDPNRPNDPSFDCDTVNRCYSDLQIVIVDNDSEL